MYSPGPMGRLWSYPLILLFSPRIFPSFYFSLCCCCSSLMMFHQKRSIFVDPFKLGACHRRLALCEGPIRIHHRADDGCDCCQLLSLFSILPLTRQCFRFYVAFRFVLTVPMASNQIDVSFLPLRRVETCINPSSFITYLLKMLCNHYSQLPAEMLVCCRIEIRQETVNQFLKKLDFNQLTFKKYIILICSS